MAEPASNRFVAFLGSINVGGHRATKDELVEVFEGLGHGAVATFLASGNVIFDVVGESVEDGEGDVGLSAGAEVALGAALGFEVPVFLRSAKEVRAIAEASPFDAAALDASTGKPQVMLLRSTPTDSDRQAALELSSGDDILSLSAGASELHWLPSGGLSDSDLDLKALRSRLGPTTIRTHNTIARITTRFLS